MPKYLSLIFAVCFLILSTCSCARTIVKKNPCDSDTGVRFYRPKPYLFIEPAPAEKPASVAGNNQTFEESIEDSEIEIYNSMQASVDQPIAVKISLHYLPDYSEEYSIRITPGLGRAKLDITLDDGWKLTNVNSETDQKTSEIISSVASLAGLLKTAARAVAKPNGIDRRVAMGFYEAVIGPDECNRKRLLGWRYIGFAPITGCSTLINSNPDVCDCHELFKLVADADGLTFEPIKGQCHKCTSKPHATYFDGAEVITPQAP